jgi:AraC-like DNA-binding protein
MAADALSDLLRTVRLTGAAFFEIVAEGPWAIASPPRELMLPKILPGADHLMAYHVVTAGRCFGTLAGGQAVALEVGEVIIFTRGQSHIMSSDPDMRADAPMPDVLEVAAASEKPFSINYGTGPNPTRLVCGYLACDSGPFNPLLETLPPVIKAGDPRNDGAGWVGNFIRFAIAEAADKRAGSESVLTKLSELMFIDVVRRYIETLPAGQSGWLAGLRDPFVGKALSLLHARPAYRWTIGDLARQAGMSRSVLAERFTELVGIPPMNYLAKWRMQIASQLLADSSANLANIAVHVGYASEAAFSRAFKNMIGVPPSTWRRPSAPKAIKAKAKAKIG